MEAQEEDQRVLPIASNIWLDKYVSKEKHLDNISSLRQLYINAIVYSLLSK